MKKAIFTVNVGGYDFPPTPSKVNRGWDKILFTDRIDNKPGWDKVVLIDPGDDPKLTSRDVKWRSHLYLPDYDLVCYHDANMEIIHPLRDRAFRIKHPTRSSLMQEADRITELGFVNDPGVIYKQLKDYSKEGFQDDQGLFQNGLFARFHSDEENEIGEMVFEHLKKYTYRDQIAYPYVLWKFGMKPKVKDIRYYWQMVDYKNHRKPRMNNTGKVNVHHITAARSDKNFGKAINDIVRMLPERDWICLRDIDTLPLDHISFIRQCEEIANANEYGLVSCMTNRLGLPWQLVYGECQSEDDTNIGVEIEMAKRMSEEHGSTVEESQREVAGVMMLFPKKIWEDVGGFQEGGIHINGQMLDNIFYEAVKETGSRIGIAKGIYLFHLYRWGESIKNIEHLR